MADTTQERVSRAHAAVREQKQANAATGPEVWEVMDTSRTGNAFSDVSLLGSFCCRACAETAVARAGADPRDAVPWPHGSGVAGFDLPDTGFVGSFRARYPSGRAGVPDTVDTVVWGPLDEEARDRVRADAAADDPWGTAGECAEKDCTNVLFDSVPARRSAEQEGPDL